MSNKFLGNNGSNNVNLSNGTATVFSSTLGALSLSPSQPVKTDAVRQLVSSKLDISDINNLQSVLNTKIGTPYQGTIKATDFETDNYVSINTQLQNVSAGNSLFGDNVSTQTAELVPYKVYESSFNGSQKGWLVLDKNNTTYYECGATRYDAQPGTFNYIGTAGLSAVNIGEWVYIDFGVPMRCNSYRLRPFMVPVSSPASWNVCTSETGLPGSWTVVDVVTDVSYTNGVFDSRVLGNLMSRYWGIEITKVSDTSQMFTIAEWSFSNRAVSSNLSSLPSDGQVARYDQGSGLLIRPSPVTIDDIGRLYTANGSSTLPGYSFSSETGSGMYFNPAGADSLGFSLGGTNILTLNPTSVKINQVTRVPDGDASTPAYSFSTDTATGVFNGGSNIIGLSSGGTLKMSVQPTTVEATVPLRLPNGTGNNPSYSFSSSPNSGMYYNGAGVSVGVSSTETLDIRSNSVTSYAPLHVPNGTKAAPSITFAQDLLTGLYAGSDPNDFVGITLGDTATPFKVYESSIQHDGTATIPNIAYDNTISGLTSTTVKTAIDEVKSKTNNLTPTSITTPAITSNTSNADWIVSSSSDFGAVYLPWQAFDNNLLNSAGWNSAAGTGYWSNPTGLPGTTSFYNFGLPLGTVFGSWIKVDMLTTKQISKYRWATAFQDDYPANIRQWKIYVSTDNTNWIQAGERSTDYTRTQGAFAWTEYFFLPAPVLAKHIIFMVTKIVGQPTPAGGECHISQIEYANDTPMAYFPSLSVGETAYLPDILYDNTISGLESTSVKYAIDELIPRVFKTNPTDCLIVGTNAGSSITTGTNNILIGNTAGSKLTSGVNSIFAGYGSGLYVTGSDNIAIGNFSSRGNEGLSTGIYNVSMGQHALTDVTSGGYNVCIGGTAGGTIKTGSNNTCIGTSANVSTEAISNSTALGRGAITTASNECVIGNGSLTHIRASTTNQCDLGTASVGYKNLYLQGNINALGTTSNISVAGTNRLTVSSLGASVNGFVDFMQPCAELYLIDNSTPTTFTDITEFSPVVGTFSWNTDVIHHMDVSTLGIMQATMSGLRTPYHVGVTISFSTVTNNDQNIIFSIFKNGVIVPGSKIQFYASSNSIRYTTAIHCMPVLAEGEYLRVMARNATNTTGVIVHDINFFAMPMSHKLSYTIPSYPVISVPAILGFDTVYYIGDIGYSVPTAGQYTYLQVGPFYYPWRAFDKLDGSTNACALTPATTFNQTFNGVTGGWIRLNITHIVKVSSYRFSTPIDNGEKPAGWRLYSSIDGTTWTLRDTREPFTWNSNGFSGESIINTGTIPLTSFTCKYLVLLITQNGSSNNSAIEEITYL